MRTGMKRVGLVAAASLLLLSWCALTKQTSLLSHYEDCSVMVLDLLTDPTLMMMRMMMMLYYVGARRFVETVLHRAKWFICLAFQYHCTHAFMTLNLV